MTAAERQRRHRAKKYAESAKGRDLPDNWPLPGFRPIEAGDFEPFDLDEFEPWTPGD